MSISVVEDDVVKVRVQCSANNQVGWNVRYFQFGATTGTGTLQDVADQLEPLAAAVYPNCLCEKARYRGLSVQLVKPAPSVEYHATAGAADGAVVGELLPTQVSGVVTLRTDLPGRFARGRVYVPFPGEGSSDPDGQPTLAYVADLANIGDFWAQPHTLAMPGGSTVAVPVIFRNVASTIYYIQTYVARTRWGTQRRRGGFGQPNFPTW